MQTTPPPALASRAASGLRAQLSRLWRASPPLTATGVVMSLAAVASLIGVLLDPRVITGAPAWLKPFKFALSTAVYSFTLAWVFTHLADRPRVRRIVGWTTAVVFMLEIAIIDTQAWRGTTSHFNAATLLDQVLYSIMGAAIILQTIISAAVVVVLWRHRFADRALGWALRFGMVLTIAGAMTGPLMTRPTPAQLVDLRAGAKVASIGAHTVGAPDGGPGLPVTGWSRDHGDVRIPHFLGLHALQALALVVLAVRRRRSEAARVRAVFVATASYAALFGVLLAHALLGHSVLAPVTLACLGVWALSTAVAWRAVVSRSSAIASVRTAEVAA